MKKLKLSFIFLIVSYFSISYAHAFTNETDISPVVYLDGKKLEFETFPVIIDGYTLVPMRKIFEELGANLSWEAESETVTVRHGYKTISYKIGENKASISYYSYDLPIAGRIIDGSTMVPLRFMAEALGAIIDWEPNTKTVIISTEQIPSAYTGIVTNISELGIIEVKEEALLEGSPPIIRHLRLIGLAPVNESGSDGNKDFITHLENLLLNKKVQYVFKVERDIHNVKDAYIYYEDGGFINSQIIANGYAQESLFVKDQTWSNLFKMLTSDAKLNKRGCWKNIDP
jgi:hypothetical protein